MIQHRDTLSVEYEIASTTTETGCQRWLQSFGRVVFDPDKGEPVGFVGLVLEVSERKEAEAALLPSQ